MFYLDHILCLACLYAEITIKHKVKLRLMGVLFVLQRFGHKVKGRELLWWSNDHQKSEPNTDRYQLYKHICDILSSIFLSLSGSGHSGSRVFQTSLSSAMRFFPISSWGIPRCSQATLDMLSLQQVMGLLWGHVWKSVGAQTDPIQLAPFYVREQNVYHELPPNARAIIEKSWMQETLAAIYRVE